MGMNLDPILAKRRSDVDRSASTFENEPEPSVADATSTLDGITLDAKPAKEWMMEQDDLGPEMEQELPPVLEERGSRPAHAPVKLTSNELQELERLKTSVADLQARLEAEHASLSKDRSALQKREAEVKAREDEVAAESQKQAASRDYPQPAWLDNVEGTYNVGVVGNAGVGKSLLINKLRNLKSGDKLWAPVGVNETTLVAKAYSFPREERVRLWDLPGAGTEAFPSETYIANMGLRYFDRVLIVSADRFTTTEIEVRKEMERHNVPYLMVRTKIDIDVWNNRQDNNLETHQTLQEIRKDLKERGVPHPYLVSSRDPGEYDFAALVKDAFPGIRRQLDSSAPSFTPQSAWNDPWNLPVVYSAAVSGLQGHWRGTDHTMYIVQGLKVHVTSRNGCGEVNLTEDEKGTVWWNARWSIDMEGISHSRSTSTLRWKPTDISARGSGWGKPMVWWYDDNPGETGWDQPWG